MISVDIKTDIKSAELKLGVLGKKIIPKAAKRALARSAKSTTTKLVREVSKKTGIKRRVVKKQIFLTIRGMDLVATIKPSKRGYNLIEFMTLAQIKRAETRKQRRRGMRVTPPGKGIKARVAGRQRFVEGAFIARGKISKKKLVFTRETEGRTSGLEAEDSGVSVIGSFRNPSMMNEAKRHAKITFTKEFNRQLKFLLSKQK